MKTISGIFRNGRIEIEHSEGWMEGKKVVVTFEDAADQMTEENWRTTPDGIEALFNRLTQNGPLFESLEEEAKFHADIEELGKWELQLPHEAPRFD